MKIAAILLNFNSADDCRKCVGYLLQQRDVELEIVIVDNASRPDDAEAVRTLCAEHSLTYIAADSNRGYNAGNNIGLRYAWERGYRYALIANPDMEFPDPTYLSRLASTLEAHPDAVAAGSDIVTPEGVHQNPMLPDGPWTSSFGWIKDILIPKRPKEAYDFIGDFRTSHQCAKLSGCALMVRLAQIESLGFFDEYPFLYCEEAIFAKQSEAAGLQMRYVADAQAIHRHITNAKGDPRPRFRQWLRSRLYFTKRYAGFPWYGRNLACASWRAYLNLMILLSTIKRK